MLTVKSQDTAGALADLGGRAGGRRRHGGRTAAAGDRAERGGQRAGRAAALRRRAPGLRLAAGHPPGTRAWWSPTGYPHPGMLHIGPVPGRRRRHRPGDRRRPDRRRLRRPGPRRRAALEVRQAAQQPRQRPPGAARPGHPGRAGRAGTRRGRRRARRRRHRAHLAGGGERPSGATWWGSARSTARQRSGGSTWQSLARGTGSTEADHLNGEIVLLGRLHGVPTPANAAVQRAVRRAVRERIAAGAFPLAELEKMIA